MAGAHSGEVNQTANFSGVNSFSINNQTSAGSERLGVCHVGGFLGASGTTSATWGGSAMSVSKLGAGGDAVMFHIVAPPTAASTVTVSNLSGATGQGAASTYTGMDQSAGAGPVRDAQTATATAASPVSVTVTTAAGDICADAVGIEINHSPSIGAFQNTVLNTTGANAADCLASYQLGADGGAMTWTYTGTSYWESVAVSFKSSSGAPAPEPTGNVDVAFILGMSMV